MGKGDIMAHMLWKRDEDKRGGGKDALLTVKVRKCVWHRFYLGIGEEEVRWGGR